MDDASGDDEEKLSAADRQTADSDRDKIEQFKVEIGECLSKQFDVPLTRSRSSFEHKASGYRFSVAVSKLYPEPDRHWFAYHPRQSIYLNSVERGHFVLGYLDTGTIFVIPVEKMDEMASHMNTTTPQGDEAKTYHHVHTIVRNGRDTLVTRADSPEFDITEFKLS